MQPHDTTVEEWRAIEGWAGYEVSNQGRIRSWKFCRRTPGQALPRIMRQDVLPVGYRQITLKDKGARRREYVHRLVLSAFVGPCPDGQQVAHWNGDKADNRLGNLRYCSPIENYDDKIRHGADTRGVRNYNASLTAEDVRRLRDCPGSHTDAARLVGCSYHKAYSVRMRLTYREQP